MTCCITCQIKQNVSEGNDLSYSTMETVDLVHTVKRITTAAAMCSPQQTHEYC